MDTRTRHIEAGAGKGIIRGQRRAEYIAEVGGGPGDRGRVDARQVALEAQIIDDECLERRVAGSLAKPEKGDIRRRAVIQPSGHSVHLAAVKVVVPVPFQLCWSDAKGSRKELHEARNAAGQRRLRPGQAEAHRVAEPELHRNAGCAADFLKLRHEWGDKAPQVGPGQVFEVNPWPEPGIDYGANHPGVFLGGLAPRPLHL